jgi:bis(5'-nucleosyl)-tetraphosphatase (symmetrical)
MCHAGIAPIWDLAEAMAMAKELELVLSGPCYADFLSHMYGNRPSQWSNDLRGMERLRTITNYFTRMRFCTAEGHLELEYKGMVINQAPSHLYPWFSVPGRKAIDADLVFGHWAALMGECPVATIHALDTGCLWGGQLTALRLQDKKRFAVPASKQQVSNN